MPWPAVFCNQKGAASKEHLSPTRQAPHLALKSQDTEISGCCNVHELFAYKRLLQQNLSSTCGHAAVKKMYPEGRARDLAAASCHSLRDSGPPGCCLAAPRNALAPDANIDVQRCIAGAVELEQALALAMQIHQDHSFCQATPSSGPPPTIRGAHRHRP